MRRNRPHRILSLEDDWFGCIVGLAIIVIAEMVYRVAL